MTQRFTFYDADLKKVIQTPAEVVSTAALGYRYDDDPPPSAIPLTAFAPQQAEAALKATEELLVVSDEPEELGASGPVELGTGVTSARIELVPQPVNDLGLLTALNTSPSSVALLVEGITLDDPGAPIYEVYLNIPTSATAAITTARTSSASWSSSAPTTTTASTDGGGTKRAFDITSLVHRLQQVGKWDPAHVEVSFVPAHLFEDEETGRPLPPVPMERDPGVHVGVVRILTE